MKIVALIICDENIYSGGYKTINSLKFFHPEIEIALYNSKEIERVKATYNINDLWFSSPFFCFDYIKNNGAPDLLIKLGGDCLVLGELNEAINSEYDVACARNDPDIGDRDERHNRPDIIRNIPNHEWVNADGVFIKNFNFLNDWLYLTWLYKEGRVLALKDYGKIYKGDDMSSLNVIFRLGNYKTKILDPKGSPIIYGSSGNGKEGPNGIEDRNHWATWKTIYFDGNKCIMPSDGRTGDRVIKILHQGGGFNMQKLDYKLFNPEFKKYIQEITKFNE